MPRFLRPFLLPLALAACNAASAQTPSANMMPDGSRDMYLGIGIESAPRYEGMDDRRTQAVPALQAQWSNGIFVAGLTAGMHLSSTPGIEYGPLLAIEPGRRDTWVQAVYVNAAVSANTGVSYAYAQVHEVGPRPEAGGFLNVYLSDSARIAASMLYGAGENRNGLIAQLDVQQSFHPSAHHTLSLLAGFNWVNKEYMQSYFGVPHDSIALTPGGSVAFVQDGFEPGAGFKDTHVSLHWNWEWSSSWMLTSQVMATRLEGNAADSPLTSRRDNFTVSTAIAYRF